MTRRRRPSLVFVVLRWLPFFIAALAFALIPLLLFGCVTRPGVTPRSLTWQERDTNHFRWPEAAPKLARTAAVTDQAVTDQAPHVVTLEWTDTVTNQPLPWLNEIHAANTLATPLPWPTIHTQTNSPFLCTHRVGHTQTNRVTLARPFAASYFYRIGIGFDPAAVH